MKTFNQMAAQGDILFRSIKELPKDVIEVKSCKSMEFVLSHSETGHKHYVKTTPNVQFFTHANDNMLAYLVVNKGTAQVEHARSFDTHESIELKKGIWEIRRQREYSPEGWRVALD